MNDEVKCFYCDGRVQSWAPKDDPWFEHIRWFPKCGFLKILKMERGLYSIENSVDTTHPTDFAGTEEGYPVSMMKLDENRNNPRTREHLIRSLIRTTKPTLEENFNEILPAPNDNSDDFLCATLTISQLKKEIKRLNEEKLCKICLDKSSEIVFRPCGHFASCNTCAISLKNCPMCRKEIISCFRVYIA